MIYVMSDIHGCYEEYIKLIKKINPTGDDTIYILGDILDKGPYPIEVLQDVMGRQNVKLLIGNHEYLLLYFIYKMGIEMSDIDDMSEIDIRDFFSYINDGGRVTIESYMNLSIEEKKNIYDYLRKCRAYVEIMVKEKKYIMVHAGIKNYEEKRKLSDYYVADFIDDRVDYTKSYFSNKNTYLITGHTPTSLINQDKSANIYKENGHIAIDCGCVYGGKLAAYCLETESALYVNAHRLY